MERFCREVLCVVVLHRFKTKNLIENPASCEILAVKRFENGGKKKSYFSRNSSKNVWCLSAKCNE